MTPQLSVQFTVVHVRVRVQLNTRVSCSLARGLRCSYFTAITPFSLSRNPSRVYHIVSHPMNFMNIHPSLVMEVTLRVRSKSMSMFFSGDAFTANCIPHLSAAASASGVRCLMMFCAKESIFASSIATSIGVQNANAMDIQIQV